ncbi:MAG TPA: TIGR03435 family protein [Acidobacteriaceae bacterium]|nr:TIGR03435 family protein [Acidobacteriaceae bacterium]
MIRRICLAGILSTNLAVAQIATAPSSHKTYAFDVVSIKPAHPDGSWHFGFRSTGYSAAGVTLGMVIQQAYFGFNMGGKDAVIRAPDWAGKDTWDIEAKVAPEDLAEYQRGGALSPMDNPVAQQMLQSMLAERCKLVVHRVPAEVPGFALVLAKDGPKLTEAPSDQTQPSGSIRAPGGGFLVPYQRGQRAVVGYYAMSMPAFALHLRGMAGGPVVDRTGLTGKYNFTLTWLSLDPNEREGSVSFDDPFPLSHWNFAALGLKVEQIQVPTEHIVIDHIEKPSPN